MKRLILLALFMFVIAGCGATMSTKSSASQAVVSAQGAATETLYGMGALLHSAPKIADALYASGKITKEQYNSIVPIYNRALASFNLAVSALDTAVDAGKDPNAVAAYSEAVLAFLVDKREIETLLLVLNGGAL